MRDRSKAYKEDRLVWKTPDSDDDQGDDNNQGDDQGDDNNQGDDDEPAPEASSGESFLLSQGLRLEVFAPRAISR